MAHEGVDAFMRKNLLVGWKRQEADHAEKLNGSFKGFLHTCLLGPVEHKLSEDANPTEPSPLSVLPRAVVVRSLIRVQLFATSWTAARQASLSFTISWSLLRLTSIESVTLSNHLILCHL